MGLWRIRNGSKQQQQVHGTVQCRLSLASSTTTTTTTIIITKRRRVVVVVVVVAVVVQMGRCVATRGVETSHNNNNNKSKMLVNLGGFACTTRNNNVLLVDHGTTGLGRVSPSHRVVVTTTTRTLSSSPKAVGSSRGTVWRTHQSESTLERFDLLGDGLS